MQNASYPNAHPEDDCDVQHVSPRQRRAQGVVPQAPVTLDPIQAPASLTPAEHAALSPRRARPALLAFMRDDALRQKDDSPACILEPVGEIDLLVIEEEALVEAAGFAKHVRSDEPRRAHAQ